MHLCSQCLRRYGRPEYAAFLRPNRSPEIQQRSLVFQWEGTQSSTQVRAKHVQTRPCAEQTAVEQQNEGFDTTDSAYLLGERAKRRFLPGHAHLRGSPRAQSPPNRTPSLRRVEPHFYLQTYQIAPKLEHGHLTKGLNRTCVRLCITKPPRAPLVDHRCTRSLSSASPFPDTAASYHSPEFLEDLADKHDDGIDKSGEEQTPPNNSNQTDRGEKPEEKEASSNTPRKKTKPLGPLGREAKNLFPKIVLDKETYFLKNPVKFSARVIDLLKSRKDDDHYKALALVRHGSSQHMRLTVSWNNLIDWAMSQGHVIEAIKLYQEMKKRGQKPDAHTYTTILRGLSQHTHHGNAVERALSIYHSMFSDTSSVEPNIIHTNAVLHICARACDMDALYGVAAKLPQRGRGAPDRFTFTTILNGLHASVADRENLEDNVIMENQNACQEAVFKGRRIWHEVVERWRHGNLLLDENLVVSMGRLLLLSNKPEDQDDLYSLLEQTMKIPRLLPPLGHPSRTENQMEQISGPKESREPKDLQKKTESGAAEDPVMHDDADDWPSIDEEMDQQNRYRRAPTSRVDRDEEHLDQSKTFAPFRSLQKKQELVRPAQKTLSLVVAACGTQRQSQLAEDYWSLLTDFRKFNIVPDHLNYVSYLRVLRFRRSSRLALETIREMYFRQKPERCQLDPEMKGFELMSSSIGYQRPSGPNPSAAYHGLPRIDLTSKSFNLAFACCNRDSNNPSMLRNAEQIHAIMQKALERPDPQALKRYIDCCLAPQHMDIKVCLRLLRDVPQAWGAIRSSMALQSARANSVLQKRLAGTYRNHAQAYCANIIKLCSIMWHNARESMSPTEQDLVRETYNLMIVFEKRAKGRRKRLEKETRESSAPASRDSTSFDEQERQSGNEDSDPKPGQDHDSAPAEPSSDPRPKTVGKDVRSPHSPSSWSGPSSRRLFS